MTAQKRTQTKKSAPRDLTVRNAKHYNREIERLQYRAKNLELAAIMLAEAFGNQKILDTIHAALKGECFR